MTYDEAVELAEAAFDEYLPKVSAATRKSFIDALFSELEDLGGLTIEDDVPDANELDFDET